MLRKPFHLAAGMGKDQAVLHRDVGIDLIQARQDLLLRLAGNLGPRVRNARDQLLLDLERASRANGSRDSGQLRVKLPSAVRDPWWQLVEEDVHEGARRTGRFDMRIGDRSGDARLHLACE